MGVGVCPLCGSVGTEEKGGLFGGECELLPAEGGVSVGDYDGVYALGSWTLLEACGEGVGDDAENHATDGALEGEGGGNPSAVFAG